MQDGAKSSQRGSGHSPACFAPRLARELEAARPLLLLPAAAHAPPSSSPHVLQLTVAGAWLTVLLASGGLYFLYLTTCADPGYIPLDQSSGGGGGSGGGSGGSGASKGGIALQRWDSNGKQQHGRSSPTAGSRAGGRSGSAVLENLALAAGHWGQLCVSCRIVRPLRAKHCPVTGRCVEAFDHYCPWVS